MTPISPAKYMTLNGGVWIDPDWNQYKYLSLWDAQRFYQNNQLSDLSLYVARRLPVRKGTVEWDWEVYPVRAEDMFFTYPNLPSEIRIKYLKGPRYVCIKIK